MVDLVSREYRVSFIIHEGSDLVVDLQISRSLINVWPWLDKAKSRCLRRNVSTF